MKRQERRWLLFTFTTTTLVSLTLGLSACKTTNQTYAPSVCSSETLQFNEDLQYDLRLFQSSLQDYQNRRTHSNINQLVRSAEDLLSTCESFKESLSEPSCLTPNDYQRQDNQYWGQNDRFQQDQRFQTSNNTLIQRDQYSSECEEAARTLGTNGQGRSDRNERRHRYDSDGGRKNDPSTSDWSSRPLEELRSREIALKVVKEQTVNQVLAQPRKLAFLNGKVVSIEETKKGRRSDVSCTLSAERRQVQFGRPMPVLEIKTQSKQSHTAYLLVTSEGIKVFCKKLNSQTMNSIDLQVAFGEAIEVRH